MAAKFFTGLPLDGPDPECVLGHGEELLAARGAEAPIPAPRGRPLVKPRRSPRPATRARSRGSSSPPARRRGELTMASSNEWFESVAEAQRRARERLPRSVYGALIAGAERGDTLADNLGAFDELGFVPRIAAGRRRPRELRPR